MKLLCQKSKKVGDKTYHRWIINIPPKDIEKLGWKAGDELEGKITERGYLISIKK